MVCAGRRLDCMAFYKREGKTTGKVVNCFFSVGAGGQRASSSDGSRAMPQLA